MIEAGTVPILKLKAIIGRRSPRSGPDMFCLGSGLKILGAVPASVLFLSDRVDIVANEFSYIHAQSVGLLGQTYLSPFLRLPDCENPIPAACR